MRSKLKKKVIIVIIILLLITLLGLIYYFCFQKEKEINHNVLFTLNEPLIQIVEYGEEYKELGAKVLIDNIDKSSMIKIDKENLNIKVLGEYKIKYYIVFNNKEYNYYRTVKVVDRTTPELTLEGNTKITMLVKETYKELGYKATDNYDGDITDKVIVENNITAEKEGTYEVTYKVSDSSGNTKEAKREVIIKKPNIITKENKEENKEKITKVKETSYSNTITVNKFTNDGIYLEGYVKNSNGNYRINLIGRENYVFDMESISSNKYKGIIKLDNIENGEYTAYVQSIESEKLLNKQDYITKIVRSKLGNKLVTINYNNNDEVGIKVEDFNYLYDVLIDPGHGGDDSGASNEYIKEKEMNLIVSKYEKCRFESHGYKVYMTRYDDTYGNGLGKAEKRLHKRAYEIGYYGIVSKIAYSNHHNAINNKQYSGYEMLMSGHLSSSSLYTEKEIANKFNNIYPARESHLRFYATDYDTEKKYSMLSSMTYNFKDNYAVNRIPYQLFNTKTIIYEGCYLTNKEDYNWYWNEKNYIKVSEAKIESYINFLGGTYNPDNTSCLN